ncbi:MAG: tetratricopeptide repeat-containing sensor histidine kinase [Bacteroidota bacterium]
MKAYNCAVSKVLCLLLLLNVCALFSQNQAGADFSTRWDSLKKLTRESFFHGSLPVAKTYALQLYDLSNKTQNDSLKIMALSIWGAIETDPQVTTKILETADSAATAFGNLSMRIQVITTLIVHLNAIGEVKRSYIKTRELMEIGRTTGDPNAIMESYLNLAQLYALVQDYPKTIDALYHLRDALVSGMKEPNLQAMRMSETYIGLGLNYSKIGKQDSAFFYIRRGIERAKKDTIISGLLRGYIELAAFHGQLATTQPNHIPLMKASLDTAAGYLSQGDWGLNVFYQRTLAYFHLLNGQPRRCIAIVDSLLHEAYKNKDLTNQVHYEELLYKSYELLHNPALAYQHYKLYAAAMDSINQDQIKKNLYIYEIDKQVNEKEIENLKLNQQSEILSFQVKWLGWGIGIFALLSVLIAISGLQWRKQARKNARLNEALRKSEQVILSSNKRLDRFASSVSHDLLANLDVMLSTANAVAGKTDQLSALQFFYRSAEQSARRMKNYCLELLESAKKDLQGPDTADLQVIVNNVIAQFRPQIEQYSVAVELGALPVIQATSALLEKAFINLMSNTLKYGINHEGKTQISIWTVETDQNWEIRFSDNGPGIPPNLQSLILNQIIPQNANSEQPGHGVGLLLTKQSLDSAGYTLTLETPHSGVVFCILVPKASKKIEKPGLN